MRENERIWENLGEFGRIWEIGGNGMWGRYDGGFGEMGEI